LLGLGLGIGSANTFPAQAQGALPPEAYRRVASWQSDPRPRLPGEFTSMAGIDADETQVYALDRAEAEVQVLDAEGRMIRRFGKPGSQPGELMQPSDIAVADGRAYVVDAGNERVQVFDTTTGRFLAVWDGLGRPGGIATDGQRIFVSDLQAPRITLLDRAGVIQARWGAGAAVNIPLISPRGMDLTADGDLIVADIGANRVLRISPAGELIRSLGPPDASPSFVVFDVAAGESGIYAICAAGVVVYERGTLAFQAERRVGLSGIALGPGQGLVAGQNDAWSVAAGVRRYEDSRQLDSVFRGEARTRFWGALPAPLGSLVGPRRITATVDGGAFVADGWPRVQRWLPGGVPGIQSRADDLVDIVAAADGDLYIVTGLGVRRVSESGAQRWAWRLPEGSGWLAAGDRDGDGLLVIDIGRRKLLRFGGLGRDGQGGFGPVASTDFSGLPADVATAAGRVFIPDNAAGQLRLLDSFGTELRAWPAPGRVIRVASPGDGASWFALTDDGWVWKYDAAGQLRAAWDGAPEGRPIDLDVNAAGAVLVADGIGDRVFVYAPDRSGQAQRPPTAGDRCDLLPDKQARPARVRAGEAVEVNLTLSGDCPSEPLPLDVVLVIDQSGSMAGPKMEAARAAAVEFVAELDYRRARAGVLLFATQFDLRQPLSDDPHALVRAIASADAAGGTNIADAVTAARDELESPRTQPGAQKAIVLMTDGRPEGGFDPVGRAIEEAQIARDAGIAVYTIGLGADVDAGLLVEMAGEADRYFGAPTAAELTRVYRQIARRLVTASLLETITVIDELPSNMEYVAGSARPAARWDGRRLNWTLGGVPPAGFRLSYQVIPQQVGRWPTNVAAAGDYVDGVGHVGQVIFPVPYVEVVGNRVAYLPALFQRACPEQRSDILLLIDTSSSMDDRNVAGGASKMEAAVQAARSFLGFLALPADRAAIVGFNGRADVVQGLTGDRAALLAALGRLPRDTGTRIDLGLAAARSVLTGPGRSPGNLPVLVLLTDGRPAGGTEGAVLSEAQAVRDAGVYVYGIGLGADADGALLVDIIGTAERYHYAPDQGALGSIYQEIAWSLPCR
jgi:Mg-chelatase subunit ChlD/DNA-binding beta-propeller fold protein YncE